jgi:serine/threonine protein kinase
MALSSGQLLQGNYRIVRLLDQGGMGAVYLAEHTRLQGRRLAIKENILDPSVDQAMRDQLRDQFYTEAKILAALDHPNLPKVSDYFIEDGVEYLVMDYVEGENLSDLLDRQVQQGKPLPEAQVLDWAEQLLSALAYMHCRHPHPVIHRDIKPANLILTPEGGSASGRLRLGQADEQRWSEHGRGYARHGHPRLHAAGAIPWQPGPHRRAH